MAENGVVSFILLSVTMVFLFFVVTSQFKKRSTNTNLFGNKFGNKFGAAHEGEIESLRDQPISWDLMSAMIDKRIAPLALNIEKINLGLATITSRLNNIDDRGDSQREMLSYLNSRIGA